MGFKTIIYPIQIWVESDLASRHFLIHAVGFVALLNWLGEFKLTYISFQPIKGNFETCENKLELLTVSF